MFSFVVETERGKGVFNGFISFDEGLVTQINVVDVSVQGLNTICASPSSGGKESSDLLNVNGLEQRVHVGVLEKRKSLFVKNGKHSSNSKNRGLISLVVRGISVVSFVTSNKVHVTLFELTKFSVFGSLNVFVNGVVLKDNNSAREVSFLIR